MTGLTSVFVVTLVTWLGIFAYLLKIDNDVRRLERAEKREDEL